MAGYSGTPLAKKLGYAPGHRVVVLDAPDDYWSLLGGLPADVVVCGPRSRGLDLIHLFCRTRAALERRLPTIQRRTKPTGMIWISWPKRASGIVTDITEDTIRDVVLPTGWVDVKVCAVDEQWSGLKVVLRRARR